MATSNYLTWHPPLPSPRTPAPPTPPSPPPSPPTPHCPHTWQLAAERPGLLPKNGTKNHIVERRAQYFSTHGFLTIYLFCSVSSKNVCTTLSGLPLLTSLDDFRRVDELENRSWSQSERVDASFDDSGIDQTTVAGRSHLRQTAESSPDFFNLVALPKLLGACFCTQIIKGRVGRKFPHVFDVGGNRQNGGGLLRRWAGVPGDESDPNEWPVTK